MNKNSSTRMTLEELVAKRARGEQSRTDLVRIDSMTDAELNAAIEQDPDWDEFRALDWTEARFVAPSPKAAISIRLDEDVIEFFKKDGRGYQSRINAVLRHYMLMNRKK